MTTGNDGAASLYCVAFRVAQLAPDGSTPAAGNMYVSDALIKLDFNPDIEAGPEIVQRNAAGNICILNRLPDLVKRLTISIQICTPDPELEQILSGGTVLTQTSDVMGYQYPAIGADPVPNGVSIEAWTRAIVDGDFATVNPFMHWAFPKVKNLHKTNRTIDATPLANAFDGFGVENANWGNGPANDWLFDSTRVAQWVRSATAPTPQLGVQPIPAQVP
jgi:hypothetical protein